MKDFKVFLFAVVIFVLACTSFGLCLEYTLNDISYHFTQVQDVYSIPDTAALKGAYSVFVRTRGISSSPYVILVDFTQPSSSKRLYLINESTGEIVLNSYVTHGRNSGDEYATSFSNQIGSLKSSRGVMITNGTFYGRHGEAIRLRGLERGINDNVGIRAIEIHAAGYAETGGRSWGCFGVPPEAMSQLLRLTGSGVILYAYTG